MVRLCRPRSHATPTLPNRPTGSMLCMQLLFAAAVIACLVVLGVRPYWNTLLRWPQKRRLMREGVKANATTVDVQQIGMEP